MNDMGHKAMTNDQSSGRYCVETNSKRWDPTMPGTFASMGPFECVMFFLSKALMWKPGENGATIRKILFLDASRAHCQAEASSVMAIELCPEEQVEGEYLIGELLKSLYGTRKAEHNGRKSGNDDHRQWFSHRLMFTSSRVLS